MARKWVLAVVAAFAAISMAGVGFASLEVGVSVLGTATAATPELQITSSYIQGCYYNGNGQSAPGSMVFDGLNAAQTSISLTLTGLVLNSACYGAIQLTNTGQAPLVLTSGVLFPGNNGICYAGEVSCYDVFTESGVQVSGHFCIGGSPTPCGYSAYISNNFTTLNPTQAYWDTIGVGFPGGSDASSPSTGSFELVYLGSEV